MEKVKKYQNIGIIISLLLIIVGAVLGFHLGRVLITGAVLFLIFLALYLALWAVVKVIRGIQNIK
jgi:uncharacterized membrane protein HdeD (DUF308 family)